MPKFFRWDYSLQGDYMEECPWWHHRLWGQNSEKKQERASISNEAKISILPFEGTLSPCPKINSIGVVETLHQAWLWLLAGSLRLDILNGVGAGGCPLPTWKSMLGSFLRALHPGWCGSSGVAASTAGGTPTTACRTSFDVVAFDTSQPSVYLCCEWYHMAGPQTAGGGKKTPQGFAVCTHLSQLL